MARGSRYRVPFRRRRTGQTNFHLRRRLILSDRPRAVGRVTNKHSLAQIIEAQREGDRTLVSAHSKELEAFGWKGGSGNLSAAYLVGYLLGLKALKKQISSVILDIGLVEPVYGSKVFAILRGLVEAGMDIPHSDSVFPSEERIKGEHIAAYAKIIAEDEEQYKSRFAGYDSRGLNPAKLPSHFETVKKTMEKTLSTK
ncbi:MAG: 50S ribosomal protein L18 [Candidatus Hodarchaeales archaeon]